MPNEGDNEQKSPGSTNEAELASSPIAACSVENRTASQSSCDIVNTANQNQLEQKQSSDCSMAQQDAAQIVNQECSKSADEQNGCDTEKTAQTSIENPMETETTPANEAVRSESDQPDQPRKKTKEEKKEEYKPPPLDEPLGTWRKVLKDVWVADNKDMKMELCETILDHVFVESENPLLEVLRLHKVCPDYCTQKSSTLAGFIMQYFDKWLKKCDRSEMYAKCLTLEIKNEAFEVATAKHTTHLQTIAEIYKLNTEEMKSNALEVVKKFLALKNYRDAVNCSVVFGLQHEIPIGQILVPCLLMNGAVAIEEYLKGHQDLQIELVQFFDDFIGRDEQDMRDRFKTLYNKGVVPMQSMKMQPKSVEKLVTKLLTSYGLQGDEVAPNLARARQEGSLRYIVYNRFVEKNMSEESYTDYVAQALKDDRHLQRYMVKYLNRVGRQDDAIRWVVYCKMDKRDVPYSVQELLTETKIREAEDKISKMRKCSRDPVSVSLFENHPVVMVDTVAGLLELIPVLDQATIVGIDSEWKPMFMSTVEKVALLQISIHTCSYLVDVIKLEQEVSQEQWTEFFEALFCRESNIKLGFDFANDMRVLKTSFPFLESMQPNMKNVICVMKLAISLMSENPTLLSLPEGDTATEQSQEQSNAGATNGANETNEKNGDEQIHFKLTDLCHKVLGEALDKREQVGNWAMRPLRTEQMKYAAMDAYCLIPIYERLKKLAEQECNLDWQVHMDRGNVVLAKPKASKKNKKKVVKVDEEELVRMMERVNAAIEASVGEERRPKDVRVVVDSMMLGLGKHLRRCGIDTVLPETRLALVECAQKDRDRYILTSGKAYDELSRNRVLYRSNRILCIPELQSKNAIEQIEFVLKLLRVKLTKDDIFSRCMDEETTTTTTTAKTANRWEEGDLSVNDWFSNTKPLSTSTSSNPQSSLSPSKESVPKRQDESQQQNEQQATSKYQQSSYQCQQRYSQYSYDSVEDSYQPWSVQNPDQFLKGNPKYRQNYSYENQNKRKNWNGTKNAANDGNQSRNPNGYQGSRNGNPSHNSSGRQNRSYYHQPNRRGQYRGNNRYNQQPKARWNEQQPKPQHQQQVDQLQTPKDSSSGSSINSISCGPATNNLTIMAPGPILLSFAPVQDGERLRVNPGGTRMTSGASSTVLEISGNSTVTLTPIGGPPRMRGRGRGRRMVQKPSERGAPKSPTVYKW